MGLFDFNDDLIDSKEAAQLLGVNPRQVREMVKEGLLLTAPVVRKPHGHLKFRREDVLLLAEVRRKRVGYAEVVAMAQQASYTARKLEVLVQRLLTVVGADVPLLDTTREGIVELYRKAERALDDVEYDSEALLFWAHAFLATGPEVLEAAEEYTGDPEPWILFLDLSKRLLFHCVEHKTNRSLEDTALMQYLGMSARELRKAAFLRVHRKLGRGAAVFLFPETLDDIHHNLSGLAISLYQRKPNTSH